MIIDQHEFFNGLDFEKCDFEYASGKRTCYKGSDGGYYRVDHFGKSYVIEFAENEEEAKNNRFEDTDLYDDSLQKNKLIKIIQSDLLKYVNE